MPGRWLMGRCRRRCSPWPSFHERHGHLARDLHRVFGIARAARSKESPASSRTPRPARSSSCPPAPRIGVIRSFATSMLVRPARCTPTPTKIVGRVTESSPMGSSLSLTRGMPARSCDRFTVWRRAKRFPGKPTGITFGQYRDHGDDNNLPAKNKRDCSSFALKRKCLTPDFTALRGFSRRLGRMMGWGAHGRKAREFHFTGKYTSVIISSSRTFEPTLT